MPEQFLSVRRSSNATLSPPTSSPVSPSRFGTSPPSSVPFLAPASPPTMTLGATSTPHTATSLSPPAIAALTNASSRNATNKLFGLFFLIVVSCALGLVSVASLIQKADTNHPQATTMVTEAMAVSTERLRGHTLSQADAAIKIVTTPAALVSTEETQIKLSVEERWRKWGNLDEYDCVGWRQTRDCTPQGELEPAKYQSCNTSIENGISGFCEIEHRTTKKRIRVMEMYCDSLRPGVQFKCADFATILNYGSRAPEYVHDPAFTYESCRERFKQDQSNALVATTPTTITEVPMSFKQGIAIVVYEKMLESVYASIRSLRSQGCRLPVELWYIANETDVHHPILQSLVANYGAFVREITDSRVTRFYTKNYAVFYSAFDQVLLLDADNFAVRDPTYLFSTTEFVSKGAMFWPDFWRFKKTIFNIQPTSFVWDVFDLDVVDMFEQESGQVLIDRRRHMKAMNVMMYYAFHAQLIEDMRLVWGDKDLFRFAWLKTKSDFHMIQMPPGSAGLKLPNRNVFCGVTMVQHDPSHEILFLHRNQEKLSHANRRIVWFHVQQFQIGQASMDDYDVRGANGGRYFPQFKRCYGKDIYYEKAFVVKPIAELPFANLEADLVEYAAEAERITNSTLAVEMT